MTYIEQAIKDAVEKGDFDPSEFIGEGDTLESWLRYDCVHDWERVLYRQAFWQALGKARGWKEKYNKVNGLLGEFLIPAEWRGRLIQFTLHLADGKDPESFFKSLYEK